MKKNLKLLLIGILCIVSSFLLYDYQIKLDELSRNLLTNSSLNDGISAVELAQAYSNSNENELLFNFTSVFIIVFGILLSIFSIYLMIKRQNN